MQKAIENYIKDESKKSISLNKIEDEIDKVAKYEIRRVREKQYVKWRKSQKRGE